MTCRTQTPCSLLFRPSPRGGWWQRIALIICLGWGTISHAAEDRIRLRIGLEDNTPPVSYAKVEGIPEGFTVELLREVGKVGGIDFEFVCSSWLHISTEFNAGRLDALANVIQTPQRRDAMEFSIGHATLRGISYTRPGEPPIRHTSQLPGKRIATLRGSIGHIKAVEHEGWGGTLTGGGSWTEIMQALRDHQCDVVLLMRPLRPQARNSMGMHLDFVEDILYEFRVALHRGDRRNLERLNDALAVVRHNGTFDRIYSKWIGPIEPHPIRLDDLRPYFIPGVGVVLVLASIFYWQRHMLRRLAQQSRALLESEEKYRRVVENAQEAIYVVQDGKIQFANSTTQRLCGIKMPELLGLPITDFTPPEDRDQVRQRHELLVSGKIPENRAEYSLLRKDGTIRTLAVAGVRIEWHGQAATLNFATDVTDSRLAETARQEAAERLHKIASRVPGFVYQFRIRADGTAAVPYASDGIEDVLRVKASEVREDASQLLGRVHPDDIAPVRATGSASGRDLTPWRHEFRVKFDDGTVRWVAGDALPQRESDGATLWHGFMSDVTERRKVDDWVRESLHEKEALLKEVHHRVKNNLQVITSLLRLEAGKSTETATQEALREMQGRVRSMALLHETLYRSGNFAGVELAAYIRQLTSQLLRAHGTTRGSVRLTLDLETVHAEIDQAIPCGLIVNELVTNSLKHAFPGATGGEVRIALQSLPEGRVRLQVGDSGAGLPTDYALHSTHSLGLRLVADLARQLGSTLEIGPGAVFAITFIARRPASPVPSPNAA